MTPTGTVGAYVLEDLGQEKHFSFSTDTSAGGLTFSKDYAGVILSS